LISTYRQRAIFATTAATPFSVVSSVHAGLFSKNFLHFQILVFANFVVDIPPFKNLFGFKLTTQAAITTAATKPAKAQDAKDHKHRKQHTEKPDREKERNIGISMHANHLLLLSKSGVAN
jgi:hypothetical protein